jgi:hypothetical protein
VKGLCKLLGKKGEWFDLFIPGKLVLVEASHLVDGIMSYELEGTKPLVSPGELEEYALSISVKGTREISMYLNVPQLELDEFVSRYKKFDLYVKDAVDSFVFRHAASALV